jgi:hypothetical protein
MAGKLAEWGCDGVEVWMSAGRKDGAGGRGRLGSGASSIALAPISAGSSVTWSSPKTSPSPSELCRSRCDRSTAGASSTAAAGLDELGGEVSARGKCRCSFHCISSLTRSSNAAASSSVSSRSPDRSARSSDVQKSTRLRVELEPELGRVGGIV